MNIDTSQQPNLSRRLREALGMLSLLLHPSKTHAAKVYEVLSTHNTLAEESLFLNLGYWESASSYDEACRALAELVGNEGAFAEGDLVLDAGFGFADEDIYWVKRFGLQKIIGLNITQSQIDVANQRVKEAQLSDRIDLRFASATNIPLDDESVDKVVALESAFHFNTREIFFHEAFRILRPGGRLTLADIAVREGWQSRSWYQQVSDSIGRLLWQIPDTNMYGASEFERKLLAAGFHNCTMRSIADKVFPPFRKFARQRIREPEVTNRLNPLFKAIWSADHHDGPANDQSIDYLIVTAERPLDS